VGPENPNQLKYLTFVPAMITLQPYRFPNLLTVREKGSDHAIHRLHPAHIHRNMVSLTFVHADRNRRSAPPNRGLQANSLSPRLRTSDRLFWAWLSRLWLGWQDALEFVQPGTVIAWQKKRFRDHWRRLS
jgi:hypothetical protein